MNHKIGSYLSPPVTGINGVPQQATCNEPAQPTKCHPRHSAHTPLHLHTCTAHLHSHCTAHLHHCTPLHLHTSCHHLVLPSPFTIPHTYCLHTITFLAFYGGAGTVTLPTYILPPYLLPPTLPLGRGGAAEGARGEPAHCLHTSVKQIQFWSTCRFTVRPENIVLGPI